MLKIEKNNILIIYNSVEYFEELLQKRNYHTCTLYPNENIITRSLKKICKKINCNDSFLFNSQLRKLKNYTTLIVFAPVDDYVLQYFKQKNPRLKIIYWFWNPAYRIGRPTAIHYNNAELWTFDNEDADRYNMQYNNSFYFNEITCTKSFDCYDIVFVGRNKHRNNTLNLYKEKFEELGLKSLFHIVPNRNEKNPNNIRELSYQEYIDVVSSSKAILDIMPPSQVGLTLRPMESLFLEKKLITDNIHIEKEPFYTPDNIFILGKDNILSLHEFLNKPYQKVDSTIKDYYDFDQWVERMINKKEDYD